MHLICEDAGYLREDAVYLLCEDAGNFREDDGYLREDTGC